MCVLKLLLSCVRFLQFRFRGRVARHMLVYISEVRVCACVCVFVNARRYIETDSSLLFWFNIHNCRTNINNSNNNSDEMPLYSLFVFITMCKCGQRLAYVPAKWTVLTYNVGNEPLNSSNNNGNNFQYHLFDKITIFVVVCVRAQYARTSRERKTLQKRYNNKLRCLALKGQVWSMGPWTNTNTSTQILIALGCVRQKCYIIGMSDLLSSIFLFYR